MSNISVSKINVSDLKTTGEACSRQISFFSNCLTHYVYLLEGDASFGNCEEEFPKKPVGRLSAICWPTDGRLSANRWPTVCQQTADCFFGELFFTITLHLVVKTIDAVHGSGPLVKQ